MVAAMGNFWLNPEGRTPLGPSRGFLAQNFELSHDLGPANQRDPRMAGMRNPGSRGLVSFGEPCQDCEKGDEAPRPRALPGGSPPPILATRIAVVDGVTGSSGRRACGAVGNDAASYMEEQLLFRTGRRQPSRIRPVVRPMVVVTLVSVESRSGRLRARLSEEANLHTRPSQ